MREDASHPVPHWTLRRKLAAVGAVMLAGNRHAHETCFIEQSHSLRRFTVNELGAELYRNARVGIVERHDSPTDTVARLEQTHALARAMELTCCHQSRGPSADNYRVEHIACFALRSHRVTG